MILAQTVSQQAPSANQCSVLQTFQWGSRPFRWKCKCSFVVLNTSRLITRCTFEENRVKYPINFYLWPVFSTVSGTCIRDYFLLCLTQICKLSVECWWDTSRDHLMNETAVFINVYTGHNGEILQLHCFMFTNKHGSMQQRDLSNIMTFPLVIGFLNYEWFLP